MNKQIVSFALAPPVAENTTDRGVYCHVIHDGNRFVISAATIGNLGVIRRGVKASVEVFGYGNAGITAHFNKEIQICLRGTGSFIFISSLNSPRIPSEIPAVTRKIEDSKYTCSFISTGGTAVLVTGPEAPDADTVAPINTEDAVPVVIESEEGTTTTTEPLVNKEENLLESNLSTLPITNLTGCRVTTTAMVRLRQQPDTDSDIIARLPYRLSLQATARIEGWYRVIYLDGQGWVSDRYLTESAGCLNEES